MKASVLLGPGWEDDSLDVLWRDSGRAFCRLKRKDEAGDIHAFIPIPTGSGHPPSRAYRQCPVKWWKSDRTIRELIGVDAAAAVDGQTAVHRRLENPRGFPTAPTPRRYAIAARISCAVLESAGVVGCCIDSALK